MGNCFALLRPNKNSQDEEAERSEKLLRIVKMDGKILEYRKSLLVKDLLVNVDSYGVGVSQTSSQHLPSEYELRTGEVYYLLPPVVTVVGAVDTTGTAIDADLSSGVKRIKVIITKRQFQELLTKNISVEEVLSRLQKRTWDGVGSSMSWKPQLEAIPEGSE